MTAFEQLIKHFKTQAALARALNLQRMTISNWKNRGIPTGRALELEHMTKGRVKAKVILEEAKRRKAEARVKPL